MAGVSGLIAVSECLRLHFFFVCTFACFARRLLGHVLGHRRREGTWSCGSQHKTKRTQPHSCGFTGMRQHFIHSALGPGVHRVIVHCLPFLFCRCGYAPTRDTHCLEFPLQTISTNHTHSNASKRMMASFSHLSSSDGRTPAPVPEGHAAHGCRGCNEEGGTERHCCMAAVDGRLEDLAHSVSQDVIPGLERELNKVSWDRGGCGRTEQASLAPHPSSVGARLACHAGGTGTRRHHRYCYHARRHGSHWTRRAFQRRWWWGQLWQRH